MATKKGNKNTLEHSLKRLEEIVNSLESGDVPLDDAVELYEEGIRISKECAEKLKSAELKIKKLSKGVEEQLQLSESDEE